MVTLYLGDKYLNDSHCMALVQYTSVKNLLYKNMILPIGLAVFHLSLLTKERRPNLTGYCYIRNFRETTYFDC